MRTVTQEVNQQLPDISQGIREMADQTEKQEAIVSKTGEDKGSGTAALDLEGVRIDPWIRITWKGNGKVS